MSSFKKKKKGAGGERMAERSPKILAGEEEVTAKRGVHSFDIQY